MTAPVVAARLCPGEGGGGLDLTTGGIDVVIFLPAVLLLLPPLLCPFAAINSRELILRCLFTLTGGGARVAFTGDGTFGAEALVL